MTQEAYAALSAVPFGSVLPYPAHGELAQDGPLPRFLAMAAVVEPLMPDGSPLDVRPVTAAAPKLHTWDLAARFEERWFQRTDGGWKRVK